jgi:endonuclease/exonuclease/phosphatase (EEP) superfamily protein YafD
MRPAIRPLQRGAALALRAGVASVVAVTSALVFAQHLAASDNAWLELSRFLPYPLFLLPALAALAVSFRLGRWWVAASLANLALWLTLGMGLQWNRGEAGAERVRVMTYNIKVMNAAQQRANAQALALEVARYDPDILLMQDAEGLLIGRSEPVQSSGPVFGLAHVYASGQYVVASRFALRDCGTAPLGSGVDGHRYLRCVVDARGVELNLVTAHFQSPRAGLNAARREGLDGADDWQRNHANRLQQSRALARDLAGSRRPLVLAGDLNAPQSSPVIASLLAVGLRDAFTSAGRGYGYSHGHSLRNGFDLLRIDHVLVSPDIGVMACFVGQSDASEHRPVIADLVLRR